MLLPFSAFCSKAYLFVTGNGAGAPKASPRGEAVERSETDEECGRKSCDFAYVSDLFRKEHARHPSSVTAFAVPPSPRGKALITFAKTYKFKGKY